MPKHDTNCKWKWPKETAKVLHNNSLTYRQAIISFLKNSIFFQSSIYTGLLNRKTSRWSNEAQKLRNIVNSRLIASDKLEEYTFAHTFSTWMAIYQNSLESQTASNCGLKSV